MVFTTLEKKIQYKPLHRNFSKKQNNENNHIKLSYNSKYKEKGTSYGPYLSIIIFCSLFQVILRTKKLEISIDLDETKRKLARIYVVFNLKITKSFRK